MADNTGSDGLSEAERLKGKCFAFKHIINMYFVTSSLKLLIQLQYY